MVQIIWEFRVRPECVQEFESHYGSRGTWAKLFERSAEFQGTALVRDMHDTQRYLTIDRWLGVESFEKFRREFREEYEHLDHRCERLAESECRIGVCADVDEVLSSDDL